MLVLWHFGEEEGLSQLTDTVQVTRLEIRSSLCLLLESKNETPHAKRV